MVLSAASSKVEMDGQRNTEQAPTAVNDGQHAYGILALAIN